VEKSEGTNSLPAIRWEIYMYNFQAALTQVGTLLFLVNRSGKDLSGVTKRFERYIILGTVGDM
jgi:hypothetical protein